MVNTINIVDDSVVRNGYNKRNYIYQQYINDIAKRSLFKLLGRNDLDSILLNPNSTSASYYLDTVESAVFSKFKEIKKLADSNGSIFTLEPKSPTYLETNIQILEAAYNDNNNDGLNMITPVSKELVTTVSDLSYSLLNLVRNDIGNYIKEYQASVKSIVTPITDKEEDRTSINFLEITPISEIVVEKGIINKLFSNNFNYTFKSDFASELIIDRILKLNYANINLDALDMEIDTEFHKYLEDMEDDPIPSFKEEVEESINNNFSFTGFINNVTGYNVDNLKDLQKLVFIWVAAIDGYMNASGDDKNMFIEMAGYLEKLINIQIKKINMYKTNEIVALGKVIRDDLYVYVIVKNYLKVLDKKKDITNIIKGFFIKNQPSIISIKIKDLNPDNYDIYDKAYDMYLNNIRYKQIISRINDLRDGYTYGFVKTNKSFLALVDNNFDIYENTKKIVDKYIITLKLDALTDVNETVYNIVKQLVFPKLIGTIEGFIKLGQRRFPNDDDGAMTFAIIMTIVEVIYSMFNIKTLNKVES